jgi:hypothetical protein
MFLQIIIFCLALSFAELDIYLHNTQDGHSIEFYDCLMAESIWYCRRPESPIDLVRDNDTALCQKNFGKPHLFSQLRTLGVNISTVLHIWHLSLEQAERYLRYLRDPHYEPDEYLCNCSSIYSFGKNCEYNISPDIRFDQWFKRQTRLKTAEHTADRIQYYGSIICYKMLECNSGLLCLDWREICDGIQQCMYGFDEDNCDILELNRCDDDEYRCTNGMCIPDEYFLDGDFDCLDWSDEILYKNDADCTNEIASSTCDDHICPLHWWSCGDGQCIEDRLAFQKGASYRECNSRRDQFFICETHFDHIMWTMNNGRCHNERYTEVALTNRTVDQRCEYLLKCTLTQGGEKYCVCFRNSGCANTLLRNCSSFDLIPYPRGGILGSHGFFLFNTTRHWLQKLPDWILINGTVRCQHGFVSIVQKIPYNTSWNVHRIIEEIFCAQTENRPSLENPISTYVCYHINDSTGICNESNRCLSIFRIKDGFNDCLNGMDELPQVDVDQSNGRIRRHHFRCSIDKTTYLRVTLLGNGRNDCENMFDEMWLGVNKKLAEMNCNNNRKDDCSRLRQYIEQSWTLSIEKETRVTSHISFRSYCDTFWNLVSQQDENLIECRQWWICSKDQWQCHRTKQCIEKSWVNDNEWDCADASDENGKFQAIIKSINRDNPDFSYYRDTRLLFASCNQTHPFPCLAPDITRKHSCISLDRIGDYHIDCAGAIDERNTLEHCDERSMLGHHFKCLSTNKCIPFWLHCWEHHRCPNKTDDEDWCYHQRYDPSRADFGKFTCFDRESSYDIRCDAMRDCLLFEDEYMCDSHSVKANKFIPYRLLKQTEIQKKRYSLELPQYPININHTERTRDPIIDSLVAISSPLMYDHSLRFPYACNRGIAPFLSSRLLTCFCPPQYYGDYCQYHADRLLVLLHLDLSRSDYTNNTDSTIVIKFVIIFMFNNQTLMIEKFHLRPALDTSVVTKKMVHFFYSRSSFFQQHRSQRLHNRSDIIHSHPYSIRIEMYQRKYNEEPIFIGVWQYPIIFDYLPVFRFAKVLRLDKPLSRKGRNPCSSNRCHQNQACQPLINEPSNYVCLCKANFTGETCAIADQQCTNGYCAPKALCKPNYRNLLRGNTFPYCICPFDRYGDRCDIEYDGCQSNPCLNGGSCYSKSTPNQTFCVCTEHFHGPRCEEKRASFNFTVDIVTNYTNAVIQYYDIDFTSLDLILIHQQIYHMVPSSMEYQHNQNRISVLIIAKLYNTNLDSSAHIHLLSLHVNVTSIDGMTQISTDNQCLHVNLLFIGNISVSQLIFILPVFQIYLLFDIIRSVLINLIYFVFMIIPTSVFVTLIILEWNASITITH